MPTLFPFKTFFSQTDPIILADIQTITDYLQEHYHAKCYIVGGAVRDRLLGVKCKDYDIECFDITITEFEEAMEYLGAKGVGKSFFVYKYHQLDIALPRKEKKVSHGHRGFEVHLATKEKEASKRRDFTVNALMYDIANKQIVDFWNGFEDLENRLLRVVDAKSFTEDSLRVLRAMQFSARFGFKIEPSSCALMRKMALDDLPKERLFSEFEKMFYAPHLHYGLYALFTLGIGSKLFGMSIKKSTFFTLARAYCSHQKNFLSHLQPYYFLFILKTHLNFDSLTLLDRLATPKRYYSKINRASVPQPITASFVATMAIKEPIYDYVGNYHTEVVRIAKALEVWDKPFECGITPTQLMQEGFRGKALGEELARRTKEKIEGLH